jgi:hypothetical protein
MAAIAPISAVNPKPTESSISRMAFSYTVGKVWAREGIVRERPHTYRKYALPRVEPSRCSIKSTRLPQGLS